MMPQPDGSWFDAHLDLAFLTECGRDLHTTVEDCRGRLLPASVTLPELAEAGVSWALGTIFTEGMPPEKFRGEREPAYGYPLGDSLAAWKAGQRQLKLYRAWAEAGLISLAGRRGSPTLRSQSPPPRLTLGVLMECADPIESPEQLNEWADGGVVAIGLAWANQARYAGGNTTTTGLTDAGRDLIRRMDDLGIVHDLSHLSDKACDELLHLTDRPVMASHSNVRTLADPTNQRHLRDNTIREIARRGGVIGLNLFSPFLRAGLKAGERATLDDCRRHLDRICELVGHDRAIGLGSDMDGGFGADRLPQGINRARDLSMLAEHLRSHGWEEASLRRFRSENWRRFWGW